MTRHRRLAQDIAFIVAVMAVGILLAYEFDVFPGEVQHPSEIELDEALALAALLCVGLLALCGHFLLTQRREVKRRMAAESEARQLALQDSLTGLPNRRRFDDELKAAIAAPPRLGGSHAVFLMDLNDFKQINDIYGHGCGDEVLIHVAVRLQRAVREGDLVARFGGDEFAVLAKHLTGPEAATTVAMRIVREFDQPIMVRETGRQVGIGIGIALIPQDACSETEALRKADIALYRAKAEADSSFCFFVSDMDERIRERDLIERELRAAIANGDIKPHFQPLIDLATKRLVGFEALARWRHPKLGDVEPERFIAVAEGCGLISRLTDHLFALAAEAAAEWPTDLTLAFNISPVQLKDRTLGLRLLGMLGKSGLSPQRLEIEITEAAVVQDLEGAKEVLGVLRDAGVRIALDDFGTGYSSLYHLRNFKVDKIKIDRSFVTDINNDPEAHSLLRALLGLGKGLGLTVTAEGVEQGVQAAILSEDGCQQAQGFLYGRAMTREEANLLVARDTQLDKAASG